MFLRQWIREGAPLAMPLGLLLVPTMFLAALKQDHAQQHGVPVGNVKFDCQVLAMPSPGTSLRHDGATPTGAESPERVDASPRSILRMSRMQQMLTRSQLAGNEPNVRYTLDEDSYIVTDEGYMIPQVPRPLVSLVWRL